MTIKTMRNKLLILFFFTALFAPSLSKAQTVILKADTITVPCHAADTFLVPVRLFDFTNVAGLQFTLSWVPADLDYIHLTNINPAFQGIGFDTTSFINQGKFTFSWTAIGGISLPDSAILFKVAYTRIGGPFTLIQFTDSPTPIAAIDPLGNDLVVETTPGAVNPVDLEPPTIACPANVTMEVFGPTAVNNIAPASLLDNCAIASTGWSSAGATVGNFPTDPDASGAVFNLGQSTVTYLTTDVGGNTASCSFLVNLTLAPNDSLTIIASNTPATCGQTVTVDISVLNFDSISGLQFSLGWDTAILQFASVGNFNPALQLSNSNFGTTQSANGFLGFAWTSNLPNGSNLANGAVMFSITFNIQGGANSGTNITFGSFPTDLVAFSSATLPPQEIGFITINGAVSITDTQAPTIVCPANVSVMAPSGSVTATVDSLEPTTLTDNCSSTVQLTYQQTGATPGMGSGPANGVFNAGLTNVVYTATDDAGNTATCSFTVTVDAGTPLTLILDTVAIDCQASGQVAVNLTVRDFVNIIGLQFNVVWDTAVLKFDSIGNQFPGLNLNSTMFFGYTSTPNGTLQFFGGNSGGWPQIPDDGTLFTIYFTVKNANGTSNIDFAGILDAVNTSFNSVPVAVINGFFQSADQSPPLLICPMDTVVNVVGNECNANVMIDIAQATDACSGVKSVTPDKTDDVYPAGTTVVTFTAEDNAGNTATCSFTVVVKDNLPPQLFNCPEDITVIANLNACTAKVNWAAPDAFDPCTNIIPTLVVSDSSGTLFPTGDSLVVYKAFDVFGDSSMCSFTVSVLDTVKPIIVCPDDFQVVANDTSCSAIVDFSLPLAFDNCDQNVALDGDATPGQTFPAGPTVVTYFATDDFGNAAICTFTITVTDLNPPVLDTCPGNILTSALPDSCGAFVEWTPPGATDDCTPDVQVTAQYNPGDFFPVGETTVMYEAQDLGGSTSTCSFTITVTEDIPPVLSNCPLGFVFNMPDDKCDTLVNWIPPTATDNCALDTILSTRLPGTVFTTGVTTVTYTAIDNAGNTATCAFQVDVQDNVPPVFSSCPFPMDTVINTDSPCGVHLDWWPLVSASDNCALDTILASRDTQALFYPGITTVLIYAIDKSNNYDTCRFEVTVNSQSVQTFTNFPQDITIDGCPQPVQWTPPGWSGYCDTPSLTTIPPGIMPGDTFPLGVTHVIYVLTDTNGVQIQDTLTITIVDDQPPLINCPSEQVVVHVGGVVLSDPGEFIDELEPFSSCDSLRIYFTLPLASDNCGTPLVAQTTGQFSGMVFAADSVHILTFVATDGAGNTANCVVNLEVQGLQPLNPLVDPLVACPGEQVILMVDSFPGAIYTWTGPNQSYPNSSHITVIASPANAGTYTVVANINGCITPLDSGQVVLASNPVANDDVDFMVDPGGTLDSINVLLNDVFSPPSDYTVTLVSPVNGVTYLGNGLFSFEAGEEPGTVSFFYEICSISCPDFCDMATVTIRIKNNDCSTIPNIITPNGDETNDYLKIPCLDSGLYRDNSIVIYNQWGDKVFEAAPYDNDPLTAWRGTLNGQPGKDLPDGVYFYIFKAGPNDPPRKGFIEIYR